MPGVTLLTSYWPETNWTGGIRLINSEGKILHHWEIQANKIWPESPHNDPAKNTKNTIRSYVHGTFLYPNGDIIFNIEYLGLVRMNSSGDILWKLPYRTHHSIFLDEDGNLWVPGTKWIESGDSRLELFQGLDPPYIEATILKVSPAGTILKEISLLESFYKGDYQHLLHHHKRLRSEPFHLNDVEILSKEFSEYFSSFNAGDILFSARNLSLIGVIDQKGKIKWINTDFFSKQHDPDFEENGWITVFDNRSNSGGSKIKKVNPASFEIKTLYNSNLEKNFFTVAGGKHQKLKNGNRLITESETGRIFEISQEGETVWEWIQQPFDRKTVPEVLEGTRYDLTEQDIATWEKANSNLN